MFYTFPNDTAAWDVNSQFMIGDSLLVAPCLQENGTDVNVYFPQGTWYGLYDHSITDASAGPKNKSLEVGTPWWQDWSRLAMFSPAFKFKFGFQVLSLWQLWYFLLQCLCICTVYGDCSTFLILVQN